MGAKFLIKKTISISSPSSNKAKHAARMHIDHMYVRISIKKESITLWKL